MDGSGPSELPPGAADPERGAGQVSSVPASPSGEAHQEVKGVVLSSVLDLSQRGLHHLEEIFKIPNIKQLHLQRNALCEIPADFFQSLPNLAWLDFRYNSIRALPSGIGSHKKQLTSDDELGSPAGGSQSQEPSSWSSGGADDLALENFAFRKKSYQNVTCGAGERDHTESLEPETLPPGVPHPPRRAEGTGCHPGLPVERVADKDAVNSQDRRGRLKEKADFLPPVEKLDPSELGKSTASPEDWPGEEEIRRFWRLRQEIVEKEREEVLAKQLLPAELPANLKAALNTKEKEHSGSRHALSACRPRGSVHRGVSDGRRKMASLRSILPALAPRQRAGLPARRAEDSRALAPREQRVSPPPAARLHCALGPRRPSSMDCVHGTPVPLTSWLGLANGGPQQEIGEEAEREGRVLLPPAPPYRRRSAAGVAGASPDPEDSGRGPGQAPASPEESEVVSKIPCAVDLADNEKMPVNPPGNVRQSREKSSQTSEEMRAFREELWEENLKQHIQKTHEGRKRFQGTAPLKEMSPAARDLAIRPGSYRIE
ncbi:leucine-rich repeat-containing protein 27 isoform X9 [Prionailurus iriomotensis]